MLMGKFRRKENYLCEEFRVSGKNVVQKARHIHTKIPRTAASSVFLLFFLMGLNKTIFLCSLGEALSPVTSLDFVTRMTCKHCCLGISIPIISRARASRSWASKEKLVCASYHSHSEARLWALPAVGKLFISKSFS